RSRGIALNGPTTRHIAIDAFQPEIMGAQFSAGGTRPFFASSARAFSDLHGSVEDVGGGAEAACLHERLVAAPKIDAKLHLLEEALLSKMAPVGRHPAVALALCRFHAAPMSTRVGEGPAESGWSRRRFIELFTEEVGVTPKIYLRLLPFQGVLQRVFGAAS